MRYYISDLHFFHDRLNTQMDNRGFENMEDMHEYMIAQWNSRIKQKDEVVILGDFSIGKGEETNEILRRLNGRKDLVIGNHDKFLKDRKFDRNLLAWVRPYEEQKENKKKIILSHYPIMCYNGQFRKNNEGLPKTYMLYGHVHNTLDEVLVNRYQNMVRQQLKVCGRGEEPSTIPCQMINCFCMFSNYVPLTLDEWIELDAKRRYDMNTIEKMRIADHENNERG